MLINSEDYERLFPMWDEEELKDILAGLQLMELVVVKTRPKGIRVRFDPVGFENLDSVVLVEFSKYSIVNTIFTPGQAEAREEREVNGDVIDDPGPMQRVLIGLHKVRKPKAVPKEIDKVYFTTAYDICFGADTLQAIALLSGEQRGRVARALGKIVDAGGDLNRLRDFEQWWRSNWRSGKEHYQFPRPENITEHWSEAMKTTRPVKQTSSPTVNVEDISERMARRAKQRRG